MRAHDSCTLTLRRILDSLLNTAQPGAGIVEGFADRLFTYLPSLIKPGKAADGAQVTCQPSRRANSPIAWLRAGV